MEQVPNWLGRLHSERDELSSKIASLIRYLTAGPDISDEDWRDLHIQLDIMKAYERILNSRIERYDDDGDES